MNNNTTSIKQNYSKVISNLKGLGNSNRVAWNEKRRYK